MTYEPMAFPAPGNLVAIARTEDFLVVAQRNRVFISLNGKPQFTWEGVVEIDDDIRHIVHLSGYIYIFTDKRPTSIQAVWGDSGVLNVTRNTLDRNLPLASIRSVSKGIGRVFFASTYALYSWAINRNTQGQFVDEITELISPEQWRNIDPYSVVGTAYEFGYIFSSEADVCAYSIIEQINVLKYH